MPLITWAAVLASVRSKTSAAWLITLAPESVPVVPPAPIWRVPSWMKVRPLLPLLPARISLPAPDLMMAVGVLLEAMLMTEAMVRSPAVLFWMIENEAPAVLERFTRRKPPVMVPPTQSGVIRMARPVKVVLPWKLTVWAVVASLKTIPWNPPLPFWVKEAPTAPGLPEKTDPTLAVQATLVAAMTLPEASVAAKASSPKVMKGLFPPPWLATPSEMTSTFGVVRWTVPPVGETRTVPPTLSLLPPP